MQIGARIRQLRQERHLSQEALAYELHVTRQAVTKWENHTALPSTANLLALCALFGVSMEALTAPPQPGQGDRLGEGRQTGGAIDPAKRPSPARWIFLGLTIMLSLLLILALSAALDSAPPDGAIGYANGPTEIYVTGIPLDVCLLAGGALLSLAATILCFYRHRRRGTAHG